LELGSKLEDLHLLVDLEITILTSHAAVEQLIEVDEATITLDTHPQKLLL